MEISLFSFALLTASPVGFLHRTFFLLTYAADHAGLAAESRSFRKTSIRNERNERNLAHSEKHRYGTNGTNGTLKALAAG